MNRWALFRFAVFAFPLLTAGRLSAVEEEADRGNKSVLTHLRAEWRRQSEVRIDSAKLSVHYFRIQDRDAKRISIDRMRSFLNDARELRRSTTEPVAIRDLSLGLQIPEKLYPNCWLSGQIIQRGEEVRNVFNADLIPAALPDSYDTSFSGGIDVFHVIDSQQANVFETRSNWKKFGVADLYNRVPPDIEIEVEVDSSAPDVFCFRANNVDYEVSSLTGDLYSARLRKDRIEDEIWQAGFQDCATADGAVVAFPHLSAQISYVDGFVTNCFFFITTAVTLNGPLESDDFKVAAPAGTNVVLFKGQFQEEDLAAIRLRNSVDDVASLVDDLRKIGELRLPASPPPASGGRFSWILLINIVGGGLLLAAWYLRRRSVKVT